VAGRWKEGDAGGCNGLLVSAEETEGDDNGEWVISVGCGTMLSIMACPLACPSSSASVGIASPSK